MTKIVTLKDLSDKHGFDRKAARKVLRKNFKSHIPRSSWQWNAGSAELKKAKKLLDLPA